jgi:phytoene desaturase
MGKRVVIVGTGPGWLATAILLAQAGLQVHILERLPRPGGRTSALEAHGFRFDLGPTFFLYPRILAEIYAAAGYDLHEEIALVRLDPQYRLVFGAGGEMHATPMLERMEQEIARLAPQDAPARALH